MKTCSAGLHPLSRDRCILEPLYRGNRYIAVTVAVTAHNDRAEQARDRQQLARCRTKQLALAVPMSSNNLYHQAFHAVPAWEALRAHASQNVTLLPLVFPSAAFGRGKPASPRRWYVQPRASKVGRVWLACPLQTVVACHPRPGARLLH